MINSQSQHVLSTQLSNPYLKNTNAWKTAAPSPSFPLFLQCWKKRFCLSCFPYWPLKIYLQSGVGALHSSETTLPKLVNDLLLTLDSGNNAVMILLDLCAAFDTQDHNTLLAHLDRARRKHHAGSVLISSIGSSLFPLVSSPHPLLWSLMGSILGPVLFSLYMLPLWGSFTAVLPP